MPRQKGRVQTMECLEGQSKKNCTLEKQGTPNSMGSS